ncbi:MAG: helix-turn-helix domain-containing protein [Methanomicrobiales archaeon]|nr:helix-turn-helix domain-containing protein [Methanomicrobiales archaeon]
MKTVPDADALQALIVRLQELEVRIQSAEQESRDIFAVLIRECHDIISESKTQLHSLIREADRIGYDLIPDLPIADKKLKDAWIALFRHAPGATADTVAEELHRHRTTVSTYLNTLVSMGLAEKERVGHEIYYKAIVLPQKVVQP